MARRQVIVLLARPKVINQQGTDLARFARLISGVSSRRRRTGRIGPRTENGRLGPSMNLRFDPSEPSGAPPGGFRRTASTPDEAAWSPARTACPGNPSGRNGLNGGTRCACRRPTSAARRLPARTVSVEDAVAQGLYPKQTPQPNQLTGLAIAGDTPEMHCAQHRTHSKRSGEKPRRNQPPPLRRRMAQGPDGWQPQYYLQRTPGSAARSCR